MILEWIDLAASSVMVAFVNGLWVGTLLAVGAWALMGLIAKRVDVNATTRYIVWGTVFVLCVGLMVWRGGETPARQNAPQHVDRVLLDESNMRHSSVLHSSPATTSPVVSEKAEPVETLTVPASRNESAEPVVEAAAPAASVSSADIRDAFQLNIPVLSNDIKRLLFALWALVAGVLFLRLIISLTWVYRIKQRSRPASRDVQLILRSILARLKSPRSVHVALSDEIDTAVAVGFINPMILIPATMPETLEADELEQVLLHEAAHLQRLDDWTMFFQHIIGALFFFHPGIYLIGRLLDRDREFACDDWVVALTKRPKAYATCLAKLVSIHVKKSQYAIIPGFASGKKQLFERVKTILDGKRKASLAPSRKVYLLVVGLLLVCTISILRIAPVVAFPVQDVSVDASEDVAPDPEVDDTEPVVEPVIAPAPEPVQQSDERIAVTPVPIVVESAPEPDSAPVRVEQPDVNAEPLQNYGAVNVDPVVVQRPVLTPAEADVNILPEARIEQKKPVRRDDDTLSKQSMIRLLKSIEKMASSGDKTHVLLTAVPKLITDSDVYVAYISAAATVTSSGDRSKALIGLLKEHRLDAVSAAKFLKVTQTLPSSGDKTRVLLAALESDSFAMSDTAISSAFIETMDTVASPGDYKRIATRLLSGSDRD